jgi:hypothetical protein
MHNLIHPYLVESVRRTPIASARKEVTMKPKEYSKFIKPFLLAALTAVLAAGAVAPDVMNIPLAWQPWLFIAAIFWSVLYFTGTLNS